MIDPLLQATVRVGEFGPWSHLLH